MVALPTHTQSYEYLHIRTTNYTQCMTLNVSSFRTNVLLARTYNINIFIPFLILLERDLLFSLGINI